MNAAYRRLYLARIFDLLEGSRRSEIIDRARGVIALWRRTANFAPYYADRWEQLLMAPAPDIRDVVMASTDEGERLRHCMPFAGVLDNKERALLRQTAKAGQ